ncbi:hypothetical protein N9K51_01795, partial [bacterium]|nr:hypothetical protein [bacterium]
RNSTGEIPNTVLLERIAVRFGCQHGLRLTKNFSLVRYYNALAWILVPRRGRRTFYILILLQSLILIQKNKSGPKSGPDLCVTSG